MLRPGLAGKMGSAGLTDEASALIDGAWGLGEAFGRSMHRDLTRFRAKCFAPTSHRAIVEGYGVIASIFRRLTDGGRLHRFS
jgi:hypothetical protein